jgi:hypothetical protein
MTAKALRLDLPVPLLAIALTAVACAGPSLRPSVFEGPLPPDKTVAAIADALIEAGRPPALVDPGTGVIVTKWTDSGYRFHEAPPFPDEVVGDVEKYLFRRYHVAVLSSHPRVGTTIRLQAEVKRCLPPVTLANNQLLGQCEDSRVGFQSFQRDLDRLGETLARAITAPAQGSTR